MKLNRWHAGMFASLFALSVFLGGCSVSPPAEHYTSARVKGEEQKINLEEVQKAFWDSKGKDLNTWMGAFEKRVNEIYEGKEVVAVDATRKDNKLVVIGYIDKVDKEGFQPGDEKLFSIEQTGDAVNNEMPYRMSGYDDRPYYSGRHSFMDNPFLQAFLISHMMGGWGSGHYYTSSPQVIVLRDYRSGYRQSPQYTQQQSSNQGFFSRFKRNSSGGMESAKKFGSSDFSASGTEKKRWFGGSSSSSSGSSSASSGSSGLSSSSSSSSSWGGRRSSSSSLFGGGGGGMRRSWGGRRR